ncbi:hypothetical protein MM817_02106 [Acidibacillus sp. S0AB]|uniref:Uncharacterized protein n=1 Tax=Sulfoacidibacillus ferrooxidans TaxID=2005001 RepID=A0A9X1VAM9_9BACL|nr:hypothetical protein [Sulfoacidibacillus ferrooxidans]
MGVPFYDCKKVAILSKSLSMYTIRSDTIEISMEYDGFVVL